jgi:hypothetical protein
MEKRILKKCKLCERVWLIEPIKTDFRGTEKELKLLERKRGREWNKCYCGAKLYD